MLYQKKGPKIFLEVHVAYYVSPAHCHCPSLVHVLERAHYAAGLKLPYRLFRDPKFIIHSETSVHCGVCT